MLSQDLVLSMLQAFPEQEPLPEQGLMPEPDPPQEPDRMLFLEQQLALAMLPMLSQLEPPHPLDRSPTIQTAQCLPQQILTL